MSHTLVDLVALALLVAVGAAVWQRVRLRQAAYQRELDRLERQNEIGRVLLTERNLRGVTHHVAVTASRLLGADMAHLTLAHEGGDRLVLEAATGALAPAVGAAVPAEGSIAGWVIGHGQPLVVNEPGNRAVPFRSLHDRAQIERSVTVPLIARGRCIGALGADNSRDGRAFGPADVDLLRDLAEYAALTVEAIQAIEELAERERHAALLNTINSRVRQSLDLPVILDTAVHELGAALGASRCYVRLRRGAELLAPAAEWAAPGIAELGARPDPAAPLVRQAFQERRTVQAADAREDPHARASAADLGGPLAALASPIILRGEAAGVLAFHQEGLPRLWRRGDVDLVQEAANELAVAIANARLYRSVEDASRELASKISELERVNRLKAQFLANMSHELRTPLNSVIGFSEILLAGVQGGRLDPEQRDALAIIARNGRHLLDLVNDVLDLSKVDAGRMELHLAPLDLNRLAASVLAGMESMIAAKEHAVRVEVAEGLVVRGDETRLRQVLFNLLSNAVKFTPPAGVIAVSAERRRASLPVGGARLAERDVVRLAVTDTGIGIAADDQSRLFTEFVQIDASHARRYEGTGLGLALCRRFVELHGGRIGVVSAPGRGSTFWVEVPVDGPRAAAA